MQVNLYATFRLLAGSKTLQIDLPPGTTVRQAVDAVIEQRPVLRSHWLDDAGEIHAHVHIFINGHDVQNMEQGEDTPLQPGDVLDFFPPVAGGINPHPALKTRPTAKAPR
jgi:molybdopterin synthase sulfur carrier subunit